MTNKGHITLIGDSILDNYPYVPEGESVIEQLRERLPDNWVATLLAVDGSVTLDVLNEQVDQIPDETTHIVLSTGGNDALNGRRYLNTPYFLGVMEQFKTDYTALLYKLSHLPPTVYGCTVYNAVPGLSDEELNGLRLFNNCIAYSLASHYIPAIDLREICTAPIDYSEVSPIEPSEVGGLKIVGAILERCLPAEHFSVDCYDAGGKICGEDGT